MKLRIISDVVLTPVVKEYRKEFPTAQVQESFEEDLVSFLLGFDPTITEPGEIIFIHSDQFFHRKPLQWQKSLLQVIQAAASKTHNKFLVSNSFQPGFSSSPLSGSAGLVTDNYLSLKSEWDALLSSPTVFIFDFVSTTLRTGIDQAYQYNLGHLYQMPYTKVFAKEFSSTLANQVNWLSSEEKKAIIVDCDNTLWQGIVGENGIEGIKCDNNAEGIIFYHFQQFLKAKKEEGFLLCICSKNNEADVKEAFQSRNWPLRWEDFILHKINWQDKWQNIQGIAGTLNIGTDSLIFIDDNPFELNSVRELVPGISCFEFKQDYAHFLKMTRDFLFRRKRVLEDDLLKTKQYETEFARKQEQATFQGIEEFIASLEIVTDIRVNDSSDLERLSQMTGKTNQFNFNKKEYTAPDLAAIIEQGGIIFSLKVSDKFGDYGTVGLILITGDMENRIIENYLMSCRALGKRIEDQFFAHVMEDLKSNNQQIQGIRFRETAKNKPASDFLNKIKNEYDIRPITGDIPVGS